MSTEPPAVQAASRVEAATTAGADALQVQPRADVSFLSPSARTSFTRVDVAGAADEEGEGEGNGVQVEQEGDGEGEHGEQQQPVVPQTPQVTLTFLLVTGKRRTMSFDPETTVGRAKELVWNAWPNEPEWQDERPSAPSYLRILYLGKILQDDDTLTQVGFPMHIPSATNGNGDSTPPLPTIVHLSIRPVPPPGAKDAPKKKSIRRRAAHEEGEEGGSAGCCSGCIIC